MVFITLYLHARGVNAIQPRCVHVPHYWLYITTRTTEQQSIVCALNKTVIALLDKVRTYIIILVIVVRVEELYTIYDREK